MAGYISGDTRKVTTHRLVEMKQRGEKISMLTSYDYTTAQIVDGAGIDVILVGDSASNGHGIPDPSCGIALCAPQYRCSHPDGPTSRKHGVPRHCPSSSRQVPY